MKLEDYKGTPIEKSFSYNNEDLIQYQQDCELLEKGFFNNEITEEQFLDYSEKLDYIYDVDSEMLLEKGGKVYKKDHSHLTLKTLTDSKGKTIHRWVNSEDKEHFKPGAKVKTMHNGVETTATVVKHVIRPVNGDYRTILKLENGKKTRKYLSHLEEMPSEEKKKDVDSKISIKGHEIYTKKNKHNLDEIHIKDSNGKEHRLTTNEPRFGQSWNHKTYLSKDDDSHISSFTGAASYPIGSNFKGFNIPKDSDTRENGNFYLSHPFTQKVIGDMIDERTKEQKLVKEGKVVNPLIEAAKTTASDEADFQPNDRITFNLPGQKGIKGFIVGQGAKASQKNYYDVKDDKGNAAYVHKKEIELLQAPKNENAGKVITVDDEDETPTPKATSKKSQKKLKDMSLEELKSKQKELSKELEGGSNRTASEIDEELSDVGREMDKKENSDDVDFEEAFKGTEEKNKIVNYKGVELSLGQPERRYVSLNTQKEGFWEDFMKLDVDGQRKVMEIAKEFHEKYAKPFNDRIDNSRTTRYANTLKPSKIA